MYLIINNKKYSVSKRVKTKDSVKFFTVTPEPVNVIDKIEMYRDDGFLLSTDCVTDYKRVSCTGTLLVLTNETEKKKQARPITEILRNRVNALEMENQTLRQQLADADEAIIEIYETMEGMNHG